MTNSVHYAWSSLFQADLSHSYGKEFLEPATEQISKASVNEIWLNTITKWRQFDLNYQIWYSFLDHSWIDTLVALTYHPSCWGITFSLSKTRRPSDTSFHFSFNLQGITQKIGAPQMTSTTSQTAPPAPQADFGPSADSGSPRGGPAEPAGPTDLACDAEPVGARGTRDDLTGGPCDGKLGSLMAGKPQ